MNIDEKSLIKRLQQDDAKAFEQLFIRYSSKIYNYSQKFLHSSEESKEIVQIVFAAVWENRAQIDEEKPFTAYIYTIARNWIVNNLKRSVYKQGFIEYQLLQIKESKFVTEEEILFNEFKYLLEKCISELPSKRREVFLLSRQEGLSYKEIAEKLSITESTVNTQITQSLEIIRKKLKLYY
jgi:RNA polymerase sigma-70 factor, ECF subfamily